PAGPGPLPWRDAARALALRRRRAADLSFVRAAAQPPRALSGELRVAGVRGRRAAHAADGDGVSRRPGRVRVRSAVLPWARAARLAGRARGWRGHDVPAAREVDGLVERRGARGADDAPAPGAAGG